MVGKSCFEKGDNLSRQSSNKSAHNLTAFQNMTGKYVAVSLKPLMCKMLVMTKAHYSEVFRPVNYIELPAK